MYINSTNTNYKGVLKMLILRNTKNEPTAVYTNLRQGIHVHCTLYTVHCTQYSVHSTHYTVQCTQYAFLRGKLSQTFLLILVRFHYILLQMILVRYNIVTPLRHRFVFAHPDFLSNLVN